MGPSPLAEFPLRELPVPYNYRVSSDKSTLDGSSAVVAAAGTHRNSTKTNVVDMQDGDEDSNELQRKRTVGSGESTPEREIFKRSKPNNHESFRQANFQCAGASSIDIDGINNLSELANDAESLSIPVEDTSAAPTATNGGQQRQVVILISISTTLP